MNTLPSLVHFTQTSSLVSLFLYFLFASFSRLSNASLLCVFSLSPCPAFVLHSLYLPRVEQGYFIWCEVAGVQVDEDEEKGEKEKEKKSKIHPLEEDRRLTVTCFCVLVSLLCRVLCLLCVCVCMCTGCGFVSLPLHLSFAKWIFQDPFGCFHPRKERTNNPAVVRNEWEKLCSICFNCSLYSSSTRWTVHNCSLVVCVCV